MLERLKKFIFSVVTIAITIALYINIEESFYRWMAILGFMIVAIVLAEEILGEEPEEFFDNFGNYKKAKISAILMGVVVIAIVMIIVNLFKWIIG